MKWILSIVVVIIVAAAALVLLPPKANAPTGGTPTTTPNPSTPPPAENADLITVDAPTRGQIITSPLTVTGKARGTWYFEASFPIEVRDAQGNTIGQGHAEAQSDWMTENFVPFKATLTFPPQPSGNKGTVVLKNDNPSGDPARDKKVEVPVTF